MQRSRSMKRLLFLTFRSCSSELLVRSRCWRAFSDSRSFAFSLSTVSWISKTSSTSLQNHITSRVHSGTKTDHWSLTFKTVLNISQSTSCVVTSLIWLCWHLYWWCYYKFSVVSDGKYILKPACMWPLNVKKGRRIQCTILTHSRHSPVFAPHYITNKRTFRKATSV